MTVKTYSSFVKLTADEGKYLYNGNVARQIVCVPIGIDYSNWVEVSKEEGENIKAQEVQEAKAHLAEMAKEEQVD